MKYLIAVLLFIALITIVCAQDAVAPRTPAEINFVVMKEAVVNALAKGDEFLKSPSQQTLDDYNIAEISCFHKLEICFDESKKILPTTSHEEAGRYLAGVDKLLNSFYEKNDILKYKVASLIAQNKALQQQKIYIAQQVDSAALLRAREHPAQAPQPAARGANTFEKSAMQSDIDNQERQIREIQQQHLDEENRRRLDGY